MADYSPEQRQKNQRTIALVTAGAVAVVLISGSMQSWSIGLYVVVLVIVGVVAACFWALFADHDARPLSTDRKHARRSSLSKKKKTDDIIKDNTKS